MLEEALARLVTLGYGVVEIVGSSIDAFCESIADGVDWEAQFGYRLAQPNLDAINDGLRRPPFPASGRLVLVCRSFFELWQADQRIAEEFLDIVSCRARDGLLFGQLMMCFVHVDDPDFQLGPVGGQAPVWNPREWLNKDRKGG